MGRYSKAPKTQFAISTAKVGNMITVVLISMMNEAITRRYDTNSFDEAVEKLVDDWVDGKIVWEWEETNEKLNSEWMEEIRVDGGKRLPFRWV